MAELARPGPLIVPGEVLVETTGLTLARLGRAAARTVIPALRALPHTEFTHPTDAFEAVGVQAAHPGLSFVDACVLWHCRERGIPAATFDARLAGLAGSV